MLSTPHKNCKSDVPNFAAYLIIGTVMFNFFNEACGMALGSIVGNASLITKVYMPKYIYPLTRPEHSQDGSFILRPEVSRHQLPDEEAVFRQPAGRRRLAADEHPGAGGGLGTIS